MNTITECRQIYLKHIDALKVPEHIKVQMREIIFAQFSIMSKTISSIELIYLRGTQTKIIKGKVCEKEIESLAFERSIDYKPWEEDLNYKEYYKEGFVQGYKICLDKMTER